MYALWGETPVPVNLGELWEKLGVYQEKTAIKFDPKAPLAEIRVAITERPRPNAVK
jgi:hypothetical protein